MTRPLYFAEGSRRLFGVYHEPVSERSSAQAVVLCPPAPQEYMNSHWAMRRLAAQLANAGAHVFRFDYFGIGDSSGESDEGTLELWQADVLAAADQLRELSRVQRVSFVGYRLGATLAWRASLTAPSKPRDLVLWDPVISGETYLREMRMADTTFNVRLLHFPAPRDPPTELCGFELPPAQYEATQAVDLLTEPVPAATRVHLVVGREDEDNRALSARLAREVRRFASVCVPEEQAKGSGNLLASRALTAIVVALSPEAA